MTLDLAFRAETAQEARQQAREWIAAEPHVLSGTIEGTARDGDRYTVTVCLVMRPTYDQETLGLSA